MPPDASSRPEIGLKRTDTSTSRYGPPGATITLKAFCTARCTSTRLPLGAPAISSTPHRPAIAFHSSSPFCSKSNRSVGAVGDTLSSSARAADPWKRCTPHHHEKPSTLSTPTTAAVPEYDTLAPRTSRSLSATASHSSRRFSLVQLFRHRPELTALDEGHLGHRVAILDGRHHTHRPISLVLLCGLIGRRPKRALGLDHRLALRLGSRQVVAARDRLRLCDLPGRGIDNNLRKSRTLLGVDRQLQLAVLHLILR